MCRHFADAARSACVVLLMFGTSSLADDEPIFDLSAAYAAQAPASDNSQAFQLAVLVDDSPSPTPATEANTESTDEDVMMLDSETPAAPVAQQGFSLWQRPAPSYPMPSRSFSLFQSPASYGWGYFERSAPTPYEPRGNGIPKRSSCYRMDYRPYTLENTSSVHGPAFYQRFELYPCEECHMQAKHNRRYFGLK